MKKKKRRSGHVKNIIHCKHHDNIIVVVSYLTTSANTSRPNGNAFIEFSTINSRGSAFSTNNNDKR